MSFPLTRHLFGKSRPEPAQDWFARALNDVRTRHRLSVKEIARRIGRTPKAVERWLAADNAPGADAITAACREWDEVWEAMRAQAQRAPSDAEQVLAEFAERLRERRTP